MQGVPVQPPIFFKNPLSGRNGEIFNVKELHLAPQWVVRCLRKRPLNETRGKVLCQRQKPLSGVSFSHLNKHRLINAIEG